MDDEATKEQFRAALQGAREDIGLVEPTEEEKRNGWTAESLTAYLQDQHAAQSLRTDPHSAMRHQPPIRANSRYRPHRWHG